MANVVEILVKGRDQFTPTAAKVQQEARGVSGTMGGLGKTVLGVAGGFVAAQLSMAGVSKLMSSTVGAAAKYEAQMAQIRALTGATKEDTDFLTGAIRDLQRTVPKSSAELGSASYFILSSGISDAADAAQVLEIAAKASTVGLGETAVVADALTTVLNAYQSGAGEAGRVTDVLMQAVKDGKAEADAFAGVLGRVVPIASQMGISFEEVAANMATFTRLGVSAEEAATGLRGVMTQLLKPSAEAEELLAGVGLSMAQIRQEVREKGLAAVLQDLITRFQGNEAAISKLFPDVRGLTNVLATAGVQADAYTEILGNMDTATGNLERGFEEVSATTQFQMQKAMNDLNVALEELGAETLPAVTAGVGLLSVAIATLGDPEATVKSISKALVDAAGNLEVVGVSGNKFKIVFGQMADSLSGSGAEIARASDITRDATDKFLDAIARFPSDIAAPAPVKPLEALGLPEMLGTFRSELTLTGSTALDMFGLMEGAGQDFTDTLMGLISPGVTNTFKSVTDLLSELRTNTETAMEGTKDAIKSVLPTVDEEFADWKARLHDMVGAYRDFQPNLQSILDLLVEAHVDSPEQIILALQQAGPEVTATMAKELAENPKAAVEGILADLGVVAGTDVQAMTDAVLQQSPAFKAAIEANIADAIKTIPSSWKTEFKTALGPGFDAGIAEAKRRLSALPDTKHISILLSAVMSDIQIAESVTSAIKAGLTGASGVPMQHGGVVRSALQLVGEQGPELTALPQGTRVFTAAETRAMLAEARGAAPIAAGPAPSGPPVVINLHLSSFFPPDPVQLQQGVRMLLPEIRRAIA